MLFFLALFFAVVWIVQKVCSRLLLPQLQGRAVLITGCDTGFGRITAERLARKSLRVFAACLTDQGVSELQALGMGEFLHAFKMDITSQESVDSGIEQVASKLPSTGLHALINNAGVLRSGVIEMSPVSDLNTVMQVNVIGMARVTRACLHLLRASKGRVVNMASVSGRIATPGVGFYSASKYAVEGMSDTLRREMAIWGVKVSLVEPGVMKTSLFEGMYTAEQQQAFWDRQTPEVQQVYGYKFVQESFTTINEVIQQFAGDPNQVADAYENAVCSRYPLRRYPVGWDANLIYLPMSIFPAWLSDWAMLALERVGGAQIPQALQTGTTTKDK